MIPDSRKILVIEGPNASGKSGLAVQLAKKLARTKWGGFNGAEIVSADSRQVYKGLDVGSGKITEKEMLGIPHHLIDVLSPKKRFTMAEFQKIAREKIAEIFSRAHLPIICGGTGFYIQSVVDNTILPNVSPNEKLRKKLSTKSAEELFIILKKLDRKRAENIDPKNPRRLVRAIEIASALGKVPNLESNKNQNNSIKFLQIGIKTDDKILKEKIHIRLLTRLTKEGMIEEVKRLHKKGLSWKRMEELGLEYRYLSRYLSGLLSKEEMLKQLESEIWQYARRQKTWFKKDRRIKWFKLNEIKKIESKIKIFLDK